ncbi:MAG TPA: DUF58 domain-containing protein [Natrialbaceae archaeon]|nr:DUF58 domain-containing protein [Natrialbaceae archaeon]
MTDPEPSIERDTYRWMGITALAFAGLAVGVLSSRPGPLLVVAVGVGYAAVARSDTPPEVTLDVEHDLSETHPEPGDEVEVELTVTNEGPDTIPDLRLADGVPDALSVSEGTPRHATALRPGGTTTIEYTITARRGRHEFDPVLAVGRDWIGAHEREVEVSTDVSIDCVASLPDSVSLPLRGQTAQQVGTVTTDTGGSGVEFHTVREYRPGDPLKRIDWKRKARTGDLATIEFREERAAIVVFVIDTRVEGYVTDENDVSAVEHSIRATGALAQALMDDGNRVGAASFGPSWTYVPPGLGRDHEVRLRDRLALGEGFSPTPDRSEFVLGLSLRRIQKHVPENAQIVFCSPVIDDVAVETTRRLEAHGHAVTVLSPDVVDDETIGSTVVDLEREDRIRNIRQTYGRVVSWDVQEPLEVAIESARRGWSR